MPRLASRAVPTIMAVLTSAVLSAPAHVQWPVTQLKNVNVLPAGISVTAFLADQKQQLTLEAIATGVFYAIMLLWVLG